MLTGIMMAIDNTSAATLPSATARMQRYVPEASAYCYAFDVWPNMCEVPTRPHVPHHAASSPTRGQLRSRVGPLARRREVPSAFRTEVGGSTPPLAPSETGTDRCRGGVLSVGDRPPRGSRPGAGERRFKVQVKSLEGRLKFKQVQVSGSTAEILEILYPATDISKAIDKAAAEVQLWRSLFIDLLGKAQREINTYVAILNCLNANRKY